MQVIGSCVVNFFGILACVLGMVFVIAFGIANCKDRSGDYTDTGFCSYKTNIDTNYTIAVVALVFILIMLFSTCFTFFIISKFSEALMTKKVTSEPVTTAPSRSSVTPVPAVTQNTRAATNQQRDSTLLTQLQVQHLQQRNRDLQSQIDILQTGTLPPPYPEPHSPTPSAPFTDPVYPPDQSLIPSIAFTGATQDIHDLPPSYESVMNTAGTNQRPSTNSSKPRPSSYRPPTVTEPPQRRMNRIMIQDRERRNRIHHQADRDRRHGVPEHHIRRWWNRP